MFCNDFKSESESIEVRAAKIPLKAEAKLAENDCLGNYSFNSHTDVQCVRNDLILNVFMKISLHKPINKQFH